MARQTGVFNEIKADQLGATRKKVRGEATRPGLRALGKGMHRRINRLMQVQQGKAKRGYEEEQKA